jgi:hypothetical protein
MAEELQMVSVIFDIILGSSGSGCNINKSHMVPIWCDVDHVTLAQLIFPCQLASFPLTYLGLLFTINRLPRCALQPLLDRMVDRLPTRKGKLLNHSGWLTVIKTTLIAGPIYTMINIKLPAWLRKVMENILKVFLWTSSDVIQGGKCLVAWTKV